MNGRELKQHERFKREAQFLRSENQHLHRELDTYRPAWHRASVRIDKLEQQVKTLEAGKKTLLQKVKDLTLDRIFVGQGSGRNQQRRRAGAATGGGGPQNQRRKPEQNGAKAWATLASLMKTATQQNRKLMDTIRSMLVAAWSSQRPPTMPTGP